MKKVMLMIVVAVMLSGCVNKEGELEVDRLGSLINGRLKDMETDISKLQNDISIINRDMSLINNEGFSLPKRKVIVIGLGVECYDLKNMDKIICKRIEFKQ